MQANDEVGTELQEEISKYPDAIWVSQSEYNRIFNALSDRAKVVDAELPGGWAAFYLPDRRLIRSDPRQSESHVMDEYVKSLAIAPEHQQVIDAIENKAMEMRNIFIKAVPRVEDNREARIALSTAIGIMTRIVANL